MLDLKVAEDRAEAIFSGLCQIWDLDHAAKYDWLWTDYWKCGNTLDAALSYLAIMPNKKSRINAYDLIAPCRDKIFLPRFDPPTDKPWRDDYGWWGLAFANACQNAESLELDADIKEMCKYEATRCWELLYQSADENRRFSTTEEDVLIGAGFACWNGRTASAQEYLEFHKTNRDPDKHYDPVPNTVTNIGFCALSIALFNIAGDTKYADAMAATLTWFLKFKPHDKMLVNAAHLVVETTNPAAHQPWCHDKARGWTADQGVFLHCLYEALKIINKLNKHTNLVDPLQKLMNELEDAYRDQTNTLIGTDSILREYETDDSLPMGDSNYSNFNDNYATGPGVFMRYLGRFYFKINDKNATGKLEKVLHASAEGAWNHRVPEDKSKGFLYDKINLWYRDFSGSRYDDYYPRPNSQIWDLALQTCGLDLYTALIRVLKHAQIPVASRAQQD
jgi:hypothetical protein